MAEILKAILWYFMVTLIGFATLPIGFQFFKNLPSRGFALIRPLGLLIWGFVFWFCGSLGILQNDLGGEIIAFTILVLLSVFILRKDVFPVIYSWIRTNWRTLLAVEIVSILAYAGWVIVRGMNPEVAYTEKPMELAFINSILRTPGIPPQDPWLSGYSISYYYFGYVLIAMITRLSGVASSVAFNLSSALWFSLTAASAYGIVFDLTVAWKCHQQGLEGTQHTVFARLAGLLGPLYMLIISTVEGVLEFLHAGGVFWKVDSSGNLVSRFWTWLAISDLNQGPRFPFTWVPNRDSGWLWWRGSRVLQDLSLNNDHIEVIDEFPFFTYLLSDLHPHLLDMPMVVLSIALALNFYLGAADFFSRHTNIQSWIKRPDFWLTALILGSLAFINTWDFPIYVGLFCAVWGLTRYQQQDWKRSIFWEFLRNGAILGLAGILLYFPFYVGFSSQAGGILPSLEFMTKGVHYWILFGALLVPIIGWLIFTWIDEKPVRTLSVGLKISGIVLIGMFSLMVLYGGLLFASLSLGPTLSASSNAFISSLGEHIYMGGSAMSGVHGNFPPGEVIRQAALRRVQSPGTWITLGVMLTFSLGLLIRRRGGDEPEDSKMVQESAQARKSVIPFVLVILLVGIVLTGFPEFFYLRDQFGTRMNTIFKFYFQGWVLFSLVASFGSVVLLHQMKGWKALFLQFSFVVIIIAGLAYPSLMLWDKTNHFSFNNWTLDGNAYIQKYYPDDYEAILWLQSAPLGVVSEAIGGSYSEFARVSTRSGQPTVLGWPGHESQWRGGGSEMGSRVGDIQTLYESSTWSEAFPIIQNYDIRYIYIGNLERSTYRVDTEKFSGKLTVAYQNQGVTIYEVPQDTGVLQP